MPAYQITVESTWSTVQCRPSQSERIGNYSIFPNNCMYHVNCPPHAFTNLDISPITNAKISLLRVILVCLFVVVVFLKTGILF